MNKDLEEVKRRFNLSTDENYLRIILNSYSQYNHRSRLDISKLLYEKLITTSDTPENLNLRGNLIGELITKLMQSLEDSALLAIMFMDTNQTPLEHYLSNNNRAFINFFRRAKRGLSDQQILRIYGLKTAKQLVANGSISKMEEYIFNAEIDYMINAPKGEKERWKKLGKLYAIDKSDRSGKKVSKKSSVVAVYHNIKHAYKVLLPDSLYRQIWKYEDSDPTLAVISKYSEFGALRPRIRKQLRPYANKKVIVLGTFPISNKTGEEFYERLFAQAQTMKLISDIQLHRLDDPSYAVRELRFSIYRRSHRESKHYETCPCGSRKKYKKCHRIKDYSFKDLEYRKNEKK